MPSSKDQRILQKITDYCDQVAETVIRLGDSFDAYASDFIYQNACAMCILQIGELVGKLSDELTAKYSNIPWRGIKATRNIFAHAYGDIDLSVTWDTIKQDLPLLKNQCTAIVNEQQVSQ